MIAGRNNLAGTGTNTAALAVGGYIGTGTTCTEVYNGTSWSTGCAMITARARLSATGTTTAALAFGGAQNPPSFAGYACTEVYDNATLCANIWLTRGNLITPRYRLAGTGCSSMGNNIALAFGGFNTNCSAPYTLGCTEAYCYAYYCTSIWSSKSGMIVPRIYVGGTGTNTAALAFGGQPPGGNARACTESFNGTSWSIGGVMIHEDQNLAGAGTNTAALAFGNNTELYNGSSWSAGSSMILPR